MELREDFTFLTNYLKEAITKPISNSLITKSLLKQIRESIYEAEDAIDSFEFVVADMESNWVPTSEIADLIISAAGKVKEVRKKVEQHINNSSGDEDELLLEYKGMPPIQEYASIFSEEEKTLRQRLKRVQVEADVIFITGPHGIGKTTLAAKMFDDAEFKQRFTKHIWVTVPNPTAERIFRVVLRQLNIHPVSNNKWELSQQVAKSLEKETFLLVLDNVPKIDEWEMLRSAFGKRGKVLITSNNDDLARFVVRHEDPIKLRPLNLDDSWTVLQLQVPPCPSELVEIGNVIARNCEGLPQKIVVVGDALARDDAQSYEMERRKEIWQQVFTGIIPFLKDGSEQHRSILSSYNALPYNLRDCYLYMGIFPKHSKFPVSKLIRMWIAEDLVQQGKPEVSLEETAQRYLRYLASRNLVTIEEDKLNCSAKMCSINELLYEFCKMEAGPEKENFLQEFRSVPGGFFPPIGKAKENHRVCVHEQLPKFMKRFISSSRQDKLQIHLRSFVSHSKEVIDLNKNDISNFCAAFKLLRVLDAKPIRVDKIHSDLCRLVHLRYIILSLSGDVVPEAISKLRNLQTLIVDTTSPVLEIEGNILKMVKLRHFKTNASATLNFPYKSKASQENECLQTLCGVSPKNCTKEFFSKLPNLKKLGICGQLALLLDGKDDELLRGIDKVEKLKLVNQKTEGKKKTKLLNWGTNPNDEGKMISLILQPSQFARSVRSLTLSGTCLEWEDISILGEVEKLKVLKLKDNAFVGDKWEVADKGFPHLETLHIESADFIQWHASSSHFPELRCLTLSKCAKLREIPVELADIKKFHLHDCKFAVEAAKKIRYMKREKHQQQGV